MATQSNSMASPQDSSNCSRYSTRAYAPARENELLASRMLAACVVDSVVFIVLGFSSVCFGFWFDRFFFGVIAAHKDIAQPVPSHDAPTKGPKTCAAFTVPRHFLPLLGKRLPSARQGLPIGGERYCLTIGRQGWHGSCYAIGKGRQDANPQTKNQKDNT